MFRTFRARLFLIAGTATFALLLVVMVSAAIAERESTQLADVERRLVPKLALGARMQARFDALARAMQEAVAAEDKAALEGTLAIRNELFRLVAGSSSFLSASDAATLRWAIHDYYETARQVSRKLIEGQTGETLAADVASMHAAHERARATIQGSTELGPTELADSFAVIRNAAASADRYRVSIALASWLLVAGLSLWVSRGLLRGLLDLSSGFSRFATGNFAQPIPVVDDDELAKVARDANQMAESLRLLAEQRDQNEWLATGRAGLSNEIHGETEPAAVAERGLSYLAERIGARAGALYVADDQGRFQLTAKYALGRVHDVASDAVVTEETRRPVASFARGEGLVGQAALRDELVVIDSPPAGYLKVRSGLGEAEPSALVFVPLHHLGKAAAVLELALFTPCSDAIRSLLTSTREALVVALEVARSRSVLKGLLDQTQAQAERLMAQEEELRMSNRELEAQQEELRRTNEELEEQRGILGAKNRELEDARTRTQEKAEELAQVSSYKSQFLANMSHELRTPLNSMLLLSHLLGQNEAKNLTAKQVEYAKTIHGAGQDLLSLINQVLDLSKIEAGKQDVDIEAVILPHFAAHATRVFGPLAADKGIEFFAEVERGAPREIETDRLLVERILTNLIGNAIKFTERGRVSLRIGRPGEGVRLRPGLSPENSIAFVVSDTGIGIAKDEQERIFSPFEQADSRSDRRFTGTGLGLAIARQSAHVLGGDIELESTPGQGSRFTLHVPELAPSSAATHAEHRRAATLAERGVTDDRDALGPEEPYVLVVEDDLVLAEQLVDIVRARGVKVIAADCGLRAIELATAHKPQGVLLDVKLPDIDGWTVMQRLRENPATRNVPVHFLSGIDAPERGLSLGAIGYLTKPASHSDLVGAVRVLTPPSPDRSSRVLVVEDSDAEGDTVLHLLAHEGLDAVRVTSAGAALSALENERFGCMILDLGLPDMDGLGFLETLRERQDVGRPRVVVHTARALTKRETRQLEAYAEAVILKDGHSEERLLEEIRLFVRHLKERTTESRADAAPPSAELSLRGTKLLLADDDMRTVYALSALLAGKGADVIVADTGREALEMLEQHSGVDAVLMDLMMPEMDGYQAMRSLRMNPSFADLPVIALTAKAMKGERERCLEAGASDYLTKPVDSALLLSTLGSWLRQGGSHGAGRQR